MSSMSPEDFAQAILELERSLQRSRESNARLYSDINSKLQQIHRLEDEVRGYKDKERRRTEKRQMRTQIIRDLKTKGVLPADYAYEEEEG